MKAGRFTIEENGNSIKTTIAVVSSLAGKIFLYALNILLIAVVVLFFIGDIGVITLFIAVMEVLLFRYSLWNLYGSETIILKKHTLTYQQFYGFIKNAFKDCKYYQNPKGDSFPRKFSGW